MHYRKHVFCCVNVRDAHHLRGCCSARGSEPLRAYMKSRAKVLKLDDVRINNAGCLERCELGPTMVIYPEGIWYHYNCIEDIDEILERHVVGGEIVERLRLSDGATIPDIYPQKHLNLAVKGVEHIADEFMRVVLESATGDDLPTIGAGAHIDLIIEELGTRRSYSLLNFEAGRNLYDIGIVREDSGSGGSQWLHKHLKKGVSIKTSLPYNNISIIDSTKPHVLVAFGKGILSMIGVMRYLAGKGVDFDVHYFRENRKHEFLLELLELYSHLKSRYIYVDYSEVDLTFFFTSKLIKPRVESEFIFCGSAEASAVVKPLIENWPLSSQQFQITGSRKRRRKKNHPFRVYLSRQRKMLKVPADQSIAQALQSLGVASHNFCDDGLCGACWTRVFHGEFECDDVAGGHQLPTKAKICKARAREANQRLILDI